MWNHEGCDEGNHPRKTDDASVYETGEGPGCSARVELRKELGLSWGTVVRVADQLEYGKESVGCWLPRLRSMRGM